MTSHTQIDNTDILSRWADTRGIARGKGANTDSLTPRMATVLRQIKCSEVTMRCGQFYAWDDELGMVARKGEEFGDLICKLFRRGYIRRIGDRLLPNDKGEAALAEKLEPKALAV